MGSTRGTNPNLGGTPETPQLGSRQQLGQQQLEQQQLETAAEEQQQEHAGATAAGAAAVAEATARAMSCETDAQLNVKS